MTTDLLQIRSLETLLASRRDLLDADTLMRATAIVRDVEREGEAALLRYARAHDGWHDERPWWYAPAELRAALDALDPVIRDDLEVAAGQIHDFAMAQRATLSDLDTIVPGGRAGHRIVPVDRAGCYAPAGRFPLPSSLLMGVMTARAAGVREVWAASPNPGPVMLAAAAIAGVDGLLAVGGAQAIAGLAFGAGPVPRCDVVVGPGNRWVTAAKYCVAGRVGIDFLAGPSELAILADASANAGMIAADLIAQAEHDPDALPVLVTTDASLLARVNIALARQLGDLPTAPIARQALAGGGAIVAGSLDAAIDAVNALAPEHLQLVVNDPASVAAQIRHAGALFLGETSAEVFGDYAIGPNHVLPTSGAARSAAGLSVFTFLRARTWLRLESPGDVVARTARMARLEGLEGHARAAEQRGR